MENKDKRETRPEGQPERSDGAPNEHRGGSEYGHDPRQKQPGPGGSRSDNGDLPPTNEPDAQRMRIGDGGPVPVPDRTYDVPDADPTKEQAEVVEGRLRRQREGEG